MTRTIIGFISFSLSTPLRFLILKWILVFVSEESIYLSIAFCRHTPRLYAYVLYQRFGYEHRRDLSMSQPLLGSNVSRIVHIARTCALHFDGFQRICIRETPAYSGLVGFWHTWMDHPLSTQLPWFHLKIDQKLRNIEKILIKWNSNNESIDGNA